MKRLLSFVAASVLLTGIIYGQAEEAAPPAVIAPTTDPASLAPVYIIPIKDQIEGALLYVIRRGLDEARHENAAAVLLVMDTPGGAVNATTEIVRSIQASGIPTYTYVENHAFSAGAIIALSTRKIFMAPHAVIGDAMPIQMSMTGGGAQEVSPGIEEKMVAAVAALIRSAAQNSGHDPDLAEKMVRRELEYSVDGEVVSPAGQLLTLTAEEAAKPRADGTPLLSAGTMDTIDDVLDALGLAGAPRKEMQITTAERLARLIAKAAPILLMLGFLGIYIESRTPGFGLPGLVGVCCLVLFYWGHHIAGLAGMEEVALLLLGLILIGIEIFLIPGFGITGVAGILLVLGSLVSAMTFKIPGMPFAVPSWADLGTAVLNTALAIGGAVVVAFLIGRYLPKSSFSNRIVLSTATSTAAGYTAVPDHAGLLGKTGTTLTALHPSGVAEIEQERYDVLTAGEFIDAGISVRVVEARGNHIVVEARSV